MAKREFCMLCHNYDPVKHHINGWFVSEKLDGMRALWDGGITRGMYARDVPWANVEKDGRYRSTIYATGLWTRAGKTIQAPDYFLDSLPEFPLDGELFIDRQEFQTLISTVKDLKPGTDWGRVRYLIFDSPSITQMFSDGDIKTPQFNKRIRGCYPFLLEHANTSLDIAHCQSFESTYKWMQMQDFENDVVQIHEQIQLGFITSETRKTVETLLQSVIEHGGEGLVLRRHVSTWVPQRSWDLLKYKPFNDAEGIVTGFVWGRETDKGSKLLGKVGALVLNYQGKRLELSGFTDEEREVEGPEVNSRGALMAGKYEHESAYRPRRFPLGTIVTFKYRELSDDGIPKEARYFRKRADYGI